MDNSPHKSDFVKSNGVNLHYLDWGGAGEALIFLTGMGCSAHLFDRIAPRFTDKFRVLALTRRGQGESDYPESGYDLDTLVYDIDRFMGAMNIEKAILAGHSLAGIELLYFTQKYPHKVLKLVFLDAVYDGKGRRDVMEQNPLKGVQDPSPKNEFASVEEYGEYVKYIRPDLASIWNDSWDECMKFDLQKDSDGLYREKDTSSIGKQMLDAMVKYNPDDANIRVPFLSFVAVSDFSLPAYFTEEQKLMSEEFERTVWQPFQQAETARMKQNIPQAKVIELQNSHHYCFMWQEDQVYEEMRKFLLV
jgi:pimeloyl-ACP methyl ester carboxylesterase